MGVSHSAISQIEAMRQGRLSPSAIVEEALDKIAIIIYKKNHDQGYL